MTDDSRHITFFHSPQSRSAGVRILLEELGASYTVHPLNMQKGEQREAAYLAVNPMGKVPAIKHGDVLVTEQAAVYMYLAELYPEAGLSPAVGDALRGPYLRWMTFYGSCFEPAAVDRAMKRDAGGQAMSPYGSFDVVIDTLAAQITPGPWFLGERFTAADVLWGTAFNWMLQFKLVPERQVFVDYAARVMARPARQRALAFDAAMNAS